MRISSSYPVLFLLQSTSVVHAGVVTRQADPEAAWTAGAWRPTDADGIPPLLGEAVSASAGKFFLYKDTVTYCPEGITGLDCAAYPGGKTVFVLRDSTVFLSVAVPGGQQVYVAPDGALSYTAPHTAAKPDGSVTDGFVRETSNAGGAPILWFIEGRNWQICPVPGNSTTMVAETSYQIYLTTGLLDGCSGFLMRTYGQASTVAWQYL